jgi:hypothetical protein
MFLQLLDVNSALAMGGQIAAIIICAFLLIMVLLLFAVNLGLAFGLTWVREKVEVIKKLRPVVDSVNTSTEAALNGVPVEENENKVVRAVASVPGGVHAANQKVEQITRKVADGVIEFRARTVQVQTVIKAFLRPAQFYPQRIQSESEVQAALEEHPQVVVEPVAASADGSKSEQERAQVMLAGQRRNSR